MLGDKAYDSAGLLVTPFAPKAKNADPLDIAGQAPLGVVHPGGWHS
jgi:hypothetical protein